MTQALNLALFANKLNTSGQTDNTGLQNSSVTVTAGTGMSGGGSVALGSSVTLTNSGVTSIVAGTGISVSGATGAVTVNSTVTGGQLQSQIFLSGTTTWTAPAGVTKVKVYCIAGGGGASGASGCAGIRPTTGGFGGAGIGVYTVVAGTGYTVTVGAGGAGGTAGQPGVTGGTSSFGSLISATGGVRGLYNSSNGANGTCTLGTVRNGNMFGGQINAANPAGNPNFAPFMSMTSRSSTTAATAFTVNSTLCAGAGGWDLGGSTGGGGVGGVVYIEWVG